MQSSKRKPLVITVVEQVTAGLLRCSHGSNTAAHLVGWSSHRVSHEIARNVP
jgi:hypothetical protein